MPRRDDESRIVTEIRRVLEVAKENEVDVLEAEIPTYSGEYTTIKLKARWIR